MHVLLVFIDGFGLGSNDPAVNPMVRFPGLFFPSLLGAPLSKELLPVRTKRLYFSPLDAKLGVAGLPQSATGQTSLFTGINAAKAMGRHIQAFPGPQLAALIAKSGLMGRIKQYGYTVTSANMYTPNYMELVTMRKRRHSATTLMTMAAGETLRTVTDLLNGKAVYQDITNTMLREIGMDVPLVSPTEAGKILISIASEHTFTMFEYFQTDRWGHKQDWLQAETILNVLDEFLLAIYHMAPADMLIVLTSDHGNFEDFSVRTHTLNPVPGLLFGSNADTVGENMRDLSDFTPAILSCVEREADNE